MTRFDMVVSNNKNMENKSNKTRKYVIGMDSIFDENGKHLLPEYPSNKIRTKVKIDFFEESFKIYLLIPQEKEQKENLNEINQLANIFVNGKRQEIIVRKFFKVSEDCSVVTIDNIDWYVPLFLNKEALMAQDIKTWEILFYYLYSREIAQALKKAQLLVGKKKG